MITTEKNDSFTKKTDERLTNQIGAYHAQEASKIYNEAAEFYNSIDEKEIAQEKAIILFKRAIPHLKACQKIDYRENRIASVLEGMKLIMNGTVDPLPLIQA